MQILSSPESEDRWRFVIFFLYCVQIGFRRIAVFLVGVQLCVQVF